LSNTRKHNALRPAPQQEAVTT